MVDKTRTPIAVAELLHSLVVMAVRQPREVSLSAASTLATLERGGPRRITELAAIEGVTQPSMTAMVSGLERSGFVARASDPVDQRAVLVTLTEGGESYLRLRRRKGAERFSELIDELPDKERRTLLAAGPALARMVELATAREVAS
ncbi:MAG TPA: MarR family transcriptional regulator [Acidimicrobiales bacterium]